jgi:hypothetical protein
VFYSLRPKLEKAVRDAETIEAWSAARTAHAAWFTVAILRAGIFYPLLERAQSTASWSACAAHDAGCVKDVATMRERQLAIIRKIVCG